MRDMQPTQGSDQRGPGVGSLYYESGAPLVQLYGSTLYQLDLLGVLLARVVDLLPRRSRGLLRLLNLDRENDFFPFPKALRFG